MRRSRLSLPQSFGIKSAGVALAAFLALVCFPRTGFSYTVVTVSTGAPAGLEQSFIAATTAQFTGAVFSNPFFANTNQILLYAPNPGYLKPVSNQDLLNALVTVDSTTYVYGWGAGTDSERWRDLGAFTASNGYLVNCSSVPYWNTLQVSTTTNQLVAIDTATCQAVLSGVYNAIYQQFFSTPTVVNGF